MRKNRVCGLIAAIGMMAAAGDAFAAVQMIDCTMNPGALAIEFNVTNPGGLAGTTYVITGPCNGNFFIFHSGITIQASSGTQTINGGLGISGGNVGLVALAINGGVEIGGSSGVELQDVTINAGLANFGVSIGSPAAVDIRTAFGTSTIGNSSTGNGVVVQGPAIVTISNTTIQNNSGAGVHAIGGAIVNVSGAISGNLGSAVLAEEGSTVTVGSDISSSAAPLVPAVIAQDSSNVRLVNAKVTGPSSNHTIVASQGSSVRLLGATVTGPSSNHTIVAFQGSRLHIRDSIVSTSSAAESAIEAGANSSAILLGGNTITNSSGGNALQIDHSSALVETSGQSFGFAAAGDSITGHGVVQVQSSMELGTGGAMPSTWTGSIVVSQNSSFRMVGGMAITGSVTLNQASNGFFRIDNGGTNGVSLGVTCPASAGNPSSHVSNPTLVTPNVTVGSTFATTTPPACLQF